MAVEQGASRAVIAILSIFLGIIIGVIGTYAMMSTWDSPSRSSVDPSTGHEPVACTQIGAEGGINISLPRSEVTPGTTARLTVDDGSPILLSAEITTGTGEGDLDYILLPVDYGYDIDLKVTLTYTNAQGQEATLTATGQPVLVEPNGPECPPHVYQLNLDVKGGALVPSAQG